MKKIIFLIIIIMIIIPTFNLTMAYAENQLKIDSESLKSSNNTAYVSITDIYGVPLFTEKTIKQKEENEANEKSNLEELNNNVFKKTGSEDNSKDNKFTKLVEQYNLFEKPKEQTKIKYIEENSSEGLINASIIIIILCILTALLTRKHYKYKSQKEDDNSEYKDYVRSESI